MKVVHAAGNIDALCLPRYYECMNPVTVKLALGDLAEVSVGYPFREAVDEMAPGPVSVVQMANVDTISGVSWANLKKITLPSERSANYLRSGDIIFTARGTRNFAVALEHVEEPAVCAPQFFVIRIKDSNSLLPGFLAWQINQSPAQGYFKRGALGSDVLNIRRDVLDRLLVVLPPVRQQEVIAHMAAAVNQERVALAKLMDNHNQQMEAIAVDLHRQGNSAHE